MHVKRHATFTISDKGNIVRIEGMNGGFRRRFLNSGSWPNHKQGSSLHRLSG
jgi:hypothetical protein